MELKTNLNKLTPDNDSEYIEYISCAIKHSDPKASVFIYKHNNKMTVTITPSDKDFKEGIIFNILEANYRLGLVVKFSSSLKIQKKISYSIDF